MSTNELIGRIHSIQSLGTVDGPGVRFVAFLAGCPLRCSCCHNPDTWDKNGGTTYTAAALAEKAVAYQAYFGQTGGITLSGGEPLCQAAFAEAVFALCHERGIHTCLDTSGAILNDDTRRLLTHCDRVLLDIKYTDDALYRRHVGMPLQTALDFLKVLNEQHIPTTLRQVVIPTINDGQENFAALRRLADAHDCVDGIELLPFRKICQVKYDAMSLSFPFAHLPEADPKAVRERELQLNT